MIDNYVTKSYQKHKILNKYIISIFEVFNRFYLPLFGSEGATLYEAFLGFVALSQLKVKATSILFIFMKANKVDNSFVSSFENQLKWRDKPSKKKFIYFYNENACFRAIMNWVFQYANDRPKLRIPTFISELVQGLDD
jgi:hypothetical protein